MGLTIDVTVELGRAEIGVNFGPCGLTIKFSKKKRITDDLTRSRFKMITDHLTGSPGSRNLHMIRAQGAREFPFWAFMNLARESSRSKRQPGREPMDHRRATVGLALAGRGCCPRSALASPASKLTPRCMPILALAGTRPTVWMRCVRAWLGSGGLDPDLFGP